MVCSLFKARCEPQLEQPLPSRQQPCMMPREAVLAHPRADILGADVVVAVGTLQREPLMRRACLVSGAGALSFMVVSQPREGLAKGQSRRQSRCHGRDGDSGRSHLRSPPRRGPVCGSGRLRSGSLEPFDLQELNCGVTRRSSALRSGRGQRLGDVEHHPVRGPRHLHLGQKDRIASA